MSKIAIISYWHNIDDLKKRLNEYSAVFSTDKISEQLLDAGVTIDAAIADFDSVVHKEETIKKLALQTEVIVLNEEKDMSDTEASLTYAIDKYPDADIDIYNMLAGRFDHTLALLSLFNLTKKKITLISPSSEVTLLLPGTYEIENIPKYTYISFHALEPVQNIVLTNFKYPVKLAHLQPFSSHLISNEFANHHQIGKITFDTGKILCIYSKDC